RTEPSEDSSDLLGLLGPEIGELRRLFGHGQRLDVDRLIAGTRAMDRPFQLASEVARDGEDVVLADDREVRIAEHPADLGRAEHPAERLLDALLDAADLASDLRQAAARRVEHAAPSVEATVDRIGDARE